MHEKVFIPVGNFAPDSRDQDTEDLNRSLNLLPIFGTYRSMSRFVDEVEQASAYPVTGTHAHLITDREARQRGYPDGSEDGAESLVNFQKYGEVDEGDDDNAANRVNESSADDSNGFELQQPAVSGTADFELIPLQATPFTELHVMRGRFKLNEYSNLATFTLIFRLRNGDDSEVAAITLTEASVVDEDNYQTVEHELTGGEVAAIIDYADLKLFVDWSCTFIATPFKVAEAVGIYAGIGQWTHEGDADDELDAIIEADEKYLDSSLDEVQRILEVAIEEITEPESKLTANTWKGVVGMRCDEVEGDGGASVLMKVFNGLTVVKEDTFAVPQAAGYTDYEIEITNLELDDWDENTKDWDDVDWADFRVSIEADSDVVVAAAINNVNTTAVVGSTAGWEAVGGSFPVVLSDVEDPATFIRGAEHSPGTISLLYDWANFTLLAADKVWVRCVADSLNDLGDIEVCISHPGDGVIQSRKERVLVTGTQNMDFELTQASIDKIVASGANGLQLEINATTLAGRETTRAKVLWCYLEVEGAAAQDFQLYVDQVRMDTPSEAGVSVSQLQFLAPSFASAAPGDRVIIYAGTQDKIYEASDTGFIDRSKAGGYGAGDGQGPWRFVSWGSAVIATNGSDPVQWQSEYGVPFEDLFTSDDKPTCRHLAVVKDFVHFANVLIPGEENDFNEAVDWWSKYNNPREVERIDLTTQSDFQPLYSVSGEITGVRGGEAVTLFKRHAIYRMSYVGPPFTFDVDLISDQEGTAYPESIVQVGRDLFFFGNGGFKVLPWGGAVANIGDGVITKMFVDTVMEDRALKLVQSEDRRELENAIVGTYDPWTRLITWIHREKDGDAYRSKVALTLNPFEDRWSSLEFLDRFGYSQILSTPNTQSEHRAITRNLVAFSWDGDTIYRERAVGTETYATRIETKILSSAFFGAPRGKHVTIHGLRLLSRVDDSDEVLGETRLPTGTRRIISAEDPWFTSGTVTEEFISAEDSVMDDGWLMLGNPISGQYFKLDFELDPIKDGAARELLGYEVDLEVSGDR